MTGARRASGGGLVAVVGSLTLLPAVSTDLYLPSLPEVAADLGSSAAGVQLTITGTLIGGAVGQLLIGPVTDRFGRRLPALCGIAVHVVLSLLCARVGGVGELITLRVLQGFAAAGGSVVAMAVVRDTYSGALAARLLSRLMLVIGAAPLLAPSVGGFVAQHWGWRAVFLALAGLGAVIGLVVLAFLPETLPPERRAARGLRTAFRGYAAIAHDRVFLGYAVLPGFVMGVLLAYVSGSSWVFQREHGLTTGQFAAVFAIVGVAQVVVAQLNAALVPRLGPVRLLRFGLPLATALAGVLVAAAVTGVGGLVGLVVLLWLIVGSIGIIMSNAAALALSRHGERRRGHRLPPGRRGRRHRLARGRAGRRGRRDGGRDRRRVRRGARRAGVGNAGLPAGGRRLSAAWTSHVPHLCAHPVEICPDSP